MSCDVVLRERLFQPVIKLLALFVLAFALAACGGSNNAPPTTPRTPTTQPMPATTPSLGGNDNTLYTQGVWRTASSTAAGFAPSRLQAVVSAAMADGTYSQAFLVIKDGELISETYRNLAAGETTAYTEYLSSRTPPQEDFNLFRDARTVASLATSWSVAKSVISLLIGIAVGQEVIPSLDTKASTYITAWRSQPALAAITIRQLLNMRAGLVPVCVSPAGEAGACTAPNGAGGDLVFADNQLNVCSLSRMVAAVGVTQPWAPQRTADGMQLPWQSGDWVYSNCDPMILGEVIVQASGMSLQEYAGRNLFSKLQMTAHWWSDNMPVGGEHHLGYCCIDATPRDFAKIGQLILNGGSWGAEQVVPSSYINLVKSILGTEFETGLGGGGFTNYGYLFWAEGPKRRTDLAGAEEMWLGANGFDGQYIAIDPVNNIVLVRNSLYYRLDPSTMRRVKVTTPPTVELGIPLTLPVIATSEAPVTSTFSLGDTQLMVKQALASQSCPGDDGGIAYSMSFERNWNADTFPTRYPADSNPRFSSFVGGVHSATHTFWEPGQPASPGIENMAEDGDTATLRAEVDAAAEAIAYVGSPTGVPSFRVNQDCSLVTFTSMMAPSIDWFIGVGGLDLRDDNGVFRDSMTVNLKLYDAGTDTRVAFSRRGRRPQDPHVPIMLLTTSATNTDFSNGVHRTTGAFVGRMIFTKMP